MGSVLLEGYRCYRLGMEADRVALASFAPHDGAGEPSC